jgi:DNA-binding NarL/FixJ family response regulator
VRKKICYIICEDNKDYRESLVAFLDEDDDLVCCGSFANAENIIKKINDCRPDIVLMDIDMPGKNGIDAVKEIKQISPGTEIIMLTVFEDRENVFDAICAGASGYLLKNTTPDIIARSIEEVMTGGAAMSPAIARKTLQFFQKPLKADALKLTVQEQQVLKFLVDGLSYKMIASKMNIVIDTIRYHIKKIYEKLHVHSAPEAVAKAIRDRLV